MIFRDGELFQILQFLDTPLYVQRFLLDRHENSEFKIIVRAMIDYLGRWPSVEDAQEMTRKDLVSGFEYHLFYRDELLGTVQDLSLDSLSLDEDFHFIPIEACRKDSSE